MIKGSLEPARFEATLLVPPEEHTGVLLAEIGGALTSPTIYSMPSWQASTLGELSEGDTLVGASWQTEGASSITGRREWIPISWSGTLAWIPAASVARVPTYDTEDLTGEITPEQPLTVHAAPTDHSDAIGTAEAGGAVAALTTPWAGWLLARERRTHRREARRRRFRRCSTRRRPPHPAVP